MLLITFDSHSLLLTTKRVISAIKTKDRRKIMFRIMDGFGVAIIAMNKIKVYMYFLASL